MSVFLRASFGRIILAVAVLLSPFITSLEFQPKPKADNSLSGWSSPTPLTFETAKPRNTAQTSGTFFSVIALSTYLFDRLPTLFSSSFYFIQDNLEHFSLSQLQRWQL